MREIIEQVDDWQSWDVIEPKSPRPSATDGFWDDVISVARQIPPLWDLTNYVAVNPFLGFSARPFAKAAREISDGLGASVLPSVDFYREHWRKGSFGMAELEQAARRGGKHPAELVAILSGQAPAPVRPVADVLTVAEWHDQQFGTLWAESVNRHAALWCAAYITDSSSPTPNVREGKGLYAAWREAAQVDRSLEIAGLKSWRAWVRALPEQADRAISRMLERLSVPVGERKAYFYRLLGGVFGWACYLRRAAWEMGSNQPGELADLLAIRICYDAAIADLAPRGSWSSARITVPPAVEDETVRAVFQDALEDGYARRLFDGLAQAPASAAATRPSVQGVFCIDVRSEPLRRHLEAQDTSIETRGFAGFFGVSLSWQSGQLQSARCPVLLKPSVQLQAETGSVSNPVADVLKGLQAAPPSTFTLVETLGLAYGLGLVGDGLNLSRSAHNSERNADFAFKQDDQAGAIALSTRVDLAASILKNMGLRNVFARLILLCGHESHSANNPHAAGLDCGACGGHSGAINARAAAAVLNDPAVRADLCGRGWELPDDTWFVPGVHDTSSDTVTLLDTEHIPASHQPDCARLQRWLDAAGVQVRAERSAALGIPAARPSRLDALLRRRARDWSEVRPEWGLARNASFIAARRSRTKSMDLQGRAFLHEYDSSTDSDNSILSLILSAPMIVASWINLQYFASTVDNQTFGCGTKALHNRVGSLGVVLGNGGDLRTGLPLQSVHSADGSWYHEPLRLQVIVEAPQGRIVAVLKAHPEVRNLVENGWVRLFALDPYSSAVSRWSPGYGWEAV